MRRLQFVGILFCLSIVACGGTEDGAGIDVIDVSGPLDRSALSFVIDSIERAADSGQVLAVIQVDSPAVLDEELLNELKGIVAAPPLPVAVWLGPAPASAFGGVGSLVLDSPVSAAAPGARLGRLVPAIAGSGTIGAGNLVGSDIPVEELDIDLQPSIRQFLQDLEGVALPTASGPIMVETLRPFESDGLEGVTLKTVTFRKPGLGTRFFRLAATPEAAFFFLVVGLTLVTFEFYALGPGVAAGVGALSLWLASWGVVNLPVRTWAVAVAVVGWGLLTMAYQRGGVLALTLLGSISLQVGGMFFVEGSGQIDTRWWLVLLSVLAALFFFLLAMPTVQRSRLSTQTIGRESLIGMSGTAVTDFDRDGMVEVAGARWRASAHREAALRIGSPVVVTGVDGLYLEVEPAALGQREN